MAVKTFNSRKNDHTHRQTKELLDGYLVPQGCFINTQSLSVKNSKIFSNCPFDVNLLMIILFSNYDTLELLYIPQQNGFSDVPRIQW